MTIVVAYIPTAYSAAALDVAITEARLRDEPLLVVNGGRGAPHHDPKSATDGQLDELRAHLAEQGVPNQVERVEGPDVGEEILAAAARVDASLIVVGIRGRTPIGKLLLGSVGQRVVMDADCPVVTVRSKAQL